MFRLSTWANVACSVVVGASGLAAAAQNSSAAQNTLNTDVAFSIIGAVLAGCHILINCLVAVKTLRARLVKECEKQWKAGLY